MALETDERTDRELGALRELQQVLEPLDVDTASRVLAWAADRYVTIPRRATMVMIGRDIHGNAVYAPRDK